MKQRKSLQVAERDNELLQRIQELKAQLKPWDFDRPWGYHRVWVYLRNNSCVVSKKRVRRLMRDYHLFADFRGPRWRWYTKAGQHILYLFGELCRLANHLPAQLTATAMRV